MSNNHLILQTTYLSVLAQILTGIYGLIGLVQDVPPEMQALEIALNIEMWVQAIEFFFYLWFVHAFDPQTMALTRYQDWVISTPLMLVSAMIYFDYERAREEGRDTSTTWEGFSREQRGTVALVVAANVLMLAFGYAGERQWLGMGPSAALGFVAFGVVFGTMWRRLASKSAAGQRLFWFIAIVWALYGVAFLFPVAPKNIAYNFLDVIAKNFFGVFLANRLIQNQAK